MALYVTDLSEEFRRNAAPAPAVTYNDPLLPGYYHLGSATGSIKGINATNVWQEFRGTFSTTLNQWKTDWESLRMDGYLGHYSDKFNMICPN